MQILETGGSTGVCYYSLSFLFSFRRFIPKLAGCTEINCSFIFRKFVLFFQTGKIVQNYMFDLKSQQVLEKKLVAIYIF